VRACAEEVLVAADRYPLYSCLYGAPVFFRKAAPQAGTALAEEEAVEALTAPSFAESSVLPAKPFPHAPGPAIGGGVVTAAGARGRASGTTVGAAPERTTVYRPTIAAAKPAEAHGRAPEHFRFSILY